MATDEVLVRVADDVRLRTLVWRPGSDAAGTPPGRPPFLLVHGLASNARLWTGVGERLADAGHLTVAVDQRGHGASDRDPSGAYDLATLTSDLVAVAAAHGLRRPVAVGQSWGGNVVLELARRHPAAVSGVVGVDGGVIDLAARFPDWDTCREALTPPRLAGTPRDELERSIRRRHPDWSEDAVAGQLANVAVRPDGTAAPNLPLADHLTILAGLWRHRPTRYLPDVRVPVLLLPVAQPDDHDGTAAKRAGIALAERSLPDLRVRWFEGYDHDVHAEAPDLVAEELLASAGAWRGRREGAA